MIVDPVFEHARRDAALLHELGLRLVATLDTHVHADHVTAAWLLKQRCGSEIVVSRASGATNADRLLDPGDLVPFGRRHLQARATPGHTGGCLTYVLDDHEHGLHRRRTADPRLRAHRLPGRQRVTAVPLGARADPLAAAEHCLLYPAHDYRGLTVTSVAEERRYNPRLGGNVNEADFAGYMEHLGLPHPKEMDIAVPANLRCGQPKGRGPPPTSPAGRRWPAPSPACGRSSRRPCTSASAAAAGATSR